MSVQDIKTYIEQNKGTYPIETLVAELRKAGHSELDIQQAIGTQLPPTISLDTSSYTTGKKVGHFLVGFFGTGVVVSILGRLIGPVAYLVVFCISVATYFQIRGKFPYIAKGILWSYLMGAIVVAVVIFFFLFIISGYHG